jgi:hypothetical protein
MEVELTGHVGYEATRSGPATPGMAPQCHEGDQADRERLSAVRGPNRLAVGGRRAAIGYCAGGPRIRDRLMAPATDGDPTNPAVQGFLRRVGPPPTWPSGARRRIARSRFREMSPDRATAGGAPYPHECDAAASLRARLRGQRADEIIRQEEGILPGAFTSGRVAVALSAAPSASDTPAVSCIRQKSAPGMTRVSAGTRQAGGARPVPVARRVPQVRPAPWVLLVRLAPPALRVGGPS